MKSHHERPEKISDALWDEEAARPNCAARRKTVSIQKED